ncbi:MAG: radical SAM protein [Bacillota bacterium]
MSELRALLIDAARRGVMPVTSVCNMGCVFCSHRYNPEGVQVARVGHRPLGEILEDVRYLPRRGRIVLGESATRVIEGELFTHPDALSIIRGISRARPGQEISVTTNGSCLNAGLVEELAAIPGLEMTVSLNSANSENRYRLMHDTEPERAIEAIGLLASAGVRFHGSLVAMPSLVGEDDVRATIRALDRWGALTVRVIHPGFSRMAPKHLFQDRETLARLVKEEAARTRMPVMLEPPALQDLSARTAGAIRGSPADRAGLVRDDVIERVNDVVAKSRVHAYRLLFDAGHPEVTYVRGGERRQVTLEKRPESSSGLVFEYDADVEVIPRVRRVMKRRGLRAVTVGCSVLAYECMRLMLAGVRGVTARPVANRFFGGNIGCAGLLTFQDILSEMKPGEHMVVDGRFVDINREDLTGRTKPDCVRDCLILL